MENLLKFIAEHTDEDVSRLILDRNKFPEIDIDLAVNCIESRRKLKGKVQEWYDEPELIFPLKLSAEQCSSSATGRYKAAFAEKICGKVKDWSIADLTGGLGVDCWFFSQKASKVIYNEMQDKLCDAARHNFKTLGADNIEVNNLIVSAENIGRAVSNADIVYVDPARRDSEGKKVFLIEDCTPDVLTLKDEIFKYSRHILIKLSPMADISMACDRLGCTCREVHVVATGGECKELLIWMDREWKDEYTVHAVELNAESEAIFSFNPQKERECRISYEQSSIIGIEAGSSYLFEPGKALMKAGAFNLIAERFTLKKLGKSTHYYICSSTEEAESVRPYGKIFEIIECQPIAKRSIKEFGLKYPKSEVTARNIPMDTETLRKKTGVKSGDDAHIFGLKSDREGNILIAAKRI